MCDPQKLAKEQRNMSLLRATISLTAAVLRQGNLTVPEATELIIVPGLRGLLKRGWKKTKLTVAAPAPHSFSKILPRLSGDESLPGKRYKFPSDKNVPRYHDHPR